MPGIKWPDSNQATICGVFCCPPKATFSQWRPRPLLHLAEALAEEGQTGGTEGGTLAARESHYLVPAFPGVHEVIFS